jgi:hypothetical protein
MKPVTLSFKEIKKIMLLIDDDAVQEQRIFQFISRNPRSITVNVNQSTSTGNISHVVRKLNKKLIPKGLMISCERPPVAVPNKFGEASQMFLWSMYRLPNQGRAANDQTAAEKAS